jgi:GNAT superfamily N-acetyltransferase
LENAVTLDLRVTPFDAPEAVALTEAVQQEYVERYGSPDQTPIEAGEFSPPLGIFVVGWRDGEPITCGGLRVIEPGVVELKRMYVVRSARRAGIARLVLRRLEAEAVLLGAHELRLETGSRQPEALAMYRAEGYLPTEKYGYYADHELSHHLAKVLRPVGSCQPDTSTARTS